MGYIRGVVHGLVLGTAVGISIAPQEGARTREQMKEAADRMRGAMQRAEETARRVAPQAREKVESVGVVIEGLRQRVTHRARDEEADMALTGMPAPSESGVLP